MTIFTEKITIIRPRRVRGPYGGLEDDWDNAEEIPIDTPVSIQPASSTETDTGRTHGITTKWLGYTEPPNLIERIRSGDRIRVEGWPPNTRMWAVAKAYQWRSILPHTEFELEEIIGTH